MVGLVKLLTMKIKFPAAICGVVQLIFGYDFFFWIMLRNDLEIWMNVVDIINT